MPRKLCKAEELLLRAPDIHAYAKEGRWPLFGSNREALVYVFEVIFPRTLWEISCFGNKNNAWHEWEKNKKT